jgi:Nuclease-related domain
VTRPDGDLVADAGASAFAEAAKQAVEMEQLRLSLDFLSDSLQQRLRSQGNWSIGAEGERAVVRTLMDLTSSGWHLLPERRWPGTRSANIDFLLVGPGGVFVGDVKSWSDVTLSEGRPPDALRSEVAALADRLRADAARPAHQRELTDPVRTTPRRGRPVRSRADP